MIPTPTFSTETFLLCLFIETIWRMCFKSSFPKCAGGAQNYVCHSNRYFFSVIAAITNFGATQSLCDVWFVVWQALTEELWNIFSERFLDCILNRDEEKFSLNCIKACRSSWQLLAFLLFLFWLSNIEIGLQLGQTAHATAFNETSTSNSKAAIFFPLFI